MKFLSNVYNPNLHNAKQHFIYSIEAMQNPSLATKEWQAHIDWVNSHIVADPQASDSYTVGELKEMGMIGIYQP